MGKRARRKFLTPERRRDIRRRRLKADLGLLLYLGVPLLAAICGYAVIQIARDDGVALGIPHYLAIAFAVCVGVASFLVARRIPGVRSYAAGLNYNRDKRSGLLLTVVVVLLLALGALIEGDGVWIGAVFFAGLTALMYRHWDNDEDLVEIEAALDRSSGPGLSSAPVSADDVPVHVTRAFRRAFGPVEGRAVVRVAIGLAVIGALIAVSSDSSPRTTGSSAFYASLAVAVLLLIALAVSAIGRAKASRVRRSAHRNDVPGVVWSCAGVPAVAVEGDGGSDATPEEETRIARQMMREAFTLHRGTGVLAISDTAVMFSNGSVSQSFALDEVDVIALIGERESPLCTVYHDGQPKIAVHLFDETGEAGDRLEMVLLAKSTAFADRRK